MTAPADTTPALAVTGLSKRFGASVALQDVDLAIGPGEVHAVLGENGSGKSTLIKILSGFHRPDAGTVTVAGQPLPFGHPASSYRLGARFVHQDLGLVDSIPVLDNLAIGAGFATRLGTISTRRSSGRAQTDLARLGLAVDPGASVGSLSPASRTGVAIARALREDPGSPVRLLVLDEPTATLPATEVERLMGIIRRVSATGVGVLYVTHRLDEIFTIAGNVTVLRDGREVATVPTSSLDHRRLVDLLVGEELTVAHHEAETLQSERDGPPEGEGPSEGEGPALSLRGITAASLDGFSADIGAGQITGIAGITGSGREMVLGAAFGAIDRTGEVMTAAGVRLAPSRPDLAMRHGLAYLPADRVRNAAILSLSARENIALSGLRPFRRFGTMWRRPERRTALTWFERLNVRPPDLVDLPLESFSGGNQQKIMFAKWLRREPAVFLLDEPTQGVDVGAKAVLHAQLVQAAAAGAAIVISSSDVDELAAICQRVIVCREGRAAADLRGVEVSARTISRECLLGSAPPASGASPTSASPASASPAGGFLDQERSAGT
jgi:ribose transport system ATP-binding protein